MTRVHIIPNDSVLVAIDIAKTRNEVLIQVLDRQRRQRMTILNQRGDHDRLISCLSAPLDKPIICGFEATGNYHRPLAGRLLESGYDVRFISSIALARTREALYKSWDKNDPKDAQVILHMLSIGASQRYYDSLAQNINDIQELSKTHEVISKAKTEVMHRLQTHYLPLYFPEVERFQRSSRNDWFLAFLDLFSIPRSITAYGKEDFIQAAWTVVGRKVAKTRLSNDIYEVASTSTGLPIPDDATAIRMFRMVIAEARGLVKQRAEIEKIAEVVLGQHRDYQSLQQIPGIGPINTLSIIAEAGDIRRFRHHWQFLKFCGLDLSTQQSGAFR